jgi:CRP-like cAMP-binding protein
VAQLSYLANQLLASLGADKITALRPRIKAVELPQETVLFETGDTIKTVYFPLSGLVSIVVDLASGEMIETAMIGNDGSVGSAALNNSNSAEHLAY